jgi:hypothetical protein
VTTNGAWILTALPPRQNDAGRDDAAGRGRSGGEARASA